MLNGHESSNAVTLRRRLRSLFKRRLSRPYIVKENMMKKLLAVSFILLVSASALAGCNTVSGAGQDVQAGGRAVQDAAE